MSYRELRNFTEMMRALGYPRLISYRYDPDTTISDRVEFENERVDFLTEIASLMAAKARVKLNTKKLYASDGRAVQEMIKIASLLYRANRSTVVAAVEDSPPAAIKVQEVKAARTLASDITQKGAKLFDLLATEATDRTERLQALRYLDIAGSAMEGTKEHASLEAAIREIIDQTKQSVEDMRKECEELELDEKNIESKTKKKQEELERTEKRLRSLENVRPQFLDEQEKLEKELQRHYDIYMEKYRNLDYLEHELETYHQNEKEREMEQERKLKKMRERLLKEEVKMLRGNSMMDDDDDAPILISGKGYSGGGNGNGGSSNYNNGYSKPNGSGQVAGNANKSRVQGSMIAQSDEESSAADSEEISGDDRGGSDDEEELSVGSGSRGGRGGGRGRGKQRDDDNDSDEFLEDDEDEDDMGDGGDDGSGGSDEQF